MGSAVSKTVRGGIISTDAFVDQPYVLALGMACALVGAGSWLLIASRWELSLFGIPVIFLLWRATLIHPMQCAVRIGMPVSTTHSIIGAIVGFGLVFAGKDGVNWDKFEKVSIYQHPGSSILEYF